MSAKGTEHCSHGKVSLVNFFVHHPVTINECIHDFILEATPPKKETNSQGPMNLGRFHVIVFGGEKQVLGTVSM